MKLFLIKLNFDVIEGKNLPYYDYYDSYVVAAHTEEEARSLFPKEKYDDLADTNWTNPEYSTCEIIGNTVRGIPKGVILGSYNQG